MSGYRKWRAAFAAAVLVLSFPLSACGGGSSESGSASAGCTPKYDTKLPHGQLKVGVFDYMPYSEFKGGKLGGIDGELVTAFAKAACLDLDPIPTPFSAAVEGVSSGRLDILIGDIYATAQRGKVVDFTEPIYLEQLGIVSKKGSGIDTVASLAGHSIASGQGYLFADDLQKLFGDHVTLYPDTAKMMEAVFSGRADAAMESYPVAVNFLKNRGVDDKYQVALPPADPGIPGTGSEVGQGVWLVNKDLSGLKGALNQYFSDIRANGELAAVLAKYGIDKSATEAGQLRILG